MKLTELLDWDELQRTIADGWVGRQIHPTEPLAILNYTHRAQYDRHWTPVVRACRGLIYNTNSLKVVARPFPKFFNYGQPEAPELDLSARCIATNKLDGSLGILYGRPRAGGYAIATRGSFTSEQALHATKIWQEQHASFVPEHGVTYLFEIIYPENRIVLNYEDLDDIVFLTALSTELGTPDAGFWSRKVAATFPYNTLADALAAPPRPDAEGLVLYFPETNDRLKIKQEDYVALHRIMTNVTPRVVWEYLTVNACKHLANPAKPQWWASSQLRLDPRRAEQILAVGDNWLEQMLSHVPDEFYDWLQSTVDRILEERQSVEADVLEAFDSIKYLADEDGRAAFVKEAKGYEFWGELLRLLDGQHITLNYWRMVYPPAANSWLNVSEDVA